MISFANLASIPARICQPLGLPTASALVGLTAIFFLTRINNEYSTGYKFDEKKFLEVGKALPESTLKAHEIARRLGIKANELTVYSFPQEPESGMLAMMRGSSVILISNELQKALMNDPMTTFTQEEAEGVLAHEIGHATNGHHLPDHHLSAKFIHFDEHEYNPNDPNSVEKWNELFYETSRAQEKEADLFTLRDLQLAKGLINRLKRAQIGKTPEVPSIKDTHPTSEQRVAYLTEALCKQTNGTDPDVCPT